MNQQVNAPPPNPRIVKNTTCEVKRVAVPAVSFSRNLRLCRLLFRQYAESKLNAEGVPYHQTEERTIEFLRGYDAAIVAFESINDQVLSALPELKVVSKLGVGLDRIDPHAMKKHGVRLGWTAGVNKLPVAELTLCLVLAALRHVVPSNASMRRGRRAVATMGRQLNGRVVGIHGCGEIGKEFIRLLQPFGCTILTNDIRPDKPFCERFNVQPVSMDELLERSEILSIHLSGTPKTRGLYDARTLGRLRSDCVLINTARGSIVDEKALKEFLTANRFAAAASDVFAVEPPTDMELLDLPNFIATPHIGAQTEEAIWRMGETAIEGLTKNFLPEPGVFPFDQS